MPLNIDIQGIVNNTMNLLQTEGLGVKINYTQVSNAGYNPTTGTPSQTNTVRTGVVAVLTTFTAEEKTEDVVVITDRKALIAYTALPIIISNNDFFIDTKTGDKWEIKKSLGFPGEPMHKLHVRRV